MNHEQRRRGPCQDGRWFSEWVPGPPNRKPWVRFNVLRIDRLPRTPRATELPSDLRFTKATKDGGQTCT
jgi:hypothetical protein